MRVRSSLDSKSSYLPPEHPPDIDTPIELNPSVSGAPEPNAEQISMLADMGFTSSQARKALRETVSRKI